LNTISIYGLRAAIELILEVGVERIGPVVQGLADCLAEGAMAKGYETMIPRTAATGAGIVSIRKPSLDARMVVSELRRHGITAAPRQGWARLSPHFYVSQEAIERVIAVLP
jgi:selenocysteine lyase/cysteine desulfurase